MASEFLTSDETARRLGIPEPAVWRWVRLGRLRPVRDRRGRFGFDPAAVAQAADHYEFGDPDAAARRRDPAMG